MVDRSQKRAKTHQKDDEILSLHIFSLLFCTSRPSFVLFILVWESLNPLASSKTNSKEQNSFSPSIVLQLLYTSALNQHKHPFSPACEKYVFGKQKFNVKQLKLNKFIFDVKQLKVNKFIFDVKQLNMKSFVKSISD